MKQIQTIGVVGAGAMGRGIAQLFVQAGLKVYCFDVAPTAVDDALNHVTTMITKSIDKGRLPATVADDLADNLCAAKQMTDLSQCDLVIEAIVEDVSIKQSVFCELEKVVASDAILASNTSSLVVADIAAKCKHPERVAGLHFFNPVPLMKVAEIIAAVRTEKSVVDALKLVVEATGHRAVIVADQPGFLVNHAGRGLYTEGLRIIEEQVASVEDVDTLMREAAGFKMGPFELMDLTGLDVSGKVMESIYHQFQQEPRFRPSSIVPPRMAAGLYGRKTGEGWYRYDAGKKMPKQSVKLPALADAVSVWIDPAADERQALTQLMSHAGVEVIDNIETASLLIIQPWGDDASHYCAAKGLDATKTVAIDPLPGLDKHRTLMLTSVTSSLARDTALALFTQDGVAATVINDSPGFVLQRVLATIVNIAANIVQRGITSVADLEDAVRLGLGYPLGPLHLGEGIGGDNVLTILQKMLDVTGDPRYRPSVWLSRRVVLNQSLLTEEALRR